MTWEGCTSWALAMSEGRIPGVAAVMVNRSSGVKLALAVVALVLILWATGSPLLSLWITPVIILFLWIAIQLGRAYRHRHRAA